jgi:hypothetical protein
VYLYCGKSGPTWNWWPEYLFRTAPIDFLYTLDEIRIWFGLFVDMHDANHTL